MNEKVNHPAHYKLPNGIECNDVAKYFDWFLGNVLKYIWRCGRKDEQGYTTQEKALEDLHKAKFYLELEINKLNENL